MKMLPNIGEQDYSLVDLDLVDLDLVDLDLVDLDLSNPDAASYRCGTRARRLSRSKSESHAAEDGMGPRESALEKELRPYERTVSCGHVPGSQLC